MKMPNFDGRYAIKKIISEYPQAKIIVATGYADEYNFKDNGITSVLRKPFNINELIQAINSVLE